MLEMKNNRIKKVLKYSCVSFCFVLLFLCSFYFITVCGNNLRYKKDVYDCKHISLNFYDALKNIGIDCTLVIGWYPSEMQNNSNRKVGHAWVNVFGMDYDPMTAQFLDRNYYVDAHNVDRVDMVERIYGDG